MQLQTGIDISDKSFSLETDIFGSDNVEFVTDKLAYFYVFKIAYNGATYYRVYVPIEASFVGGNEKSLWRVRAVNGWGKLKDDVIGGYILDDTKKWFFGIKGTYQLVDAVLNAVVNSTGVGKLLLNGLGGVLGLQQTAEISIGYYGTGLNDLFHRLYTFDFEDATVEQIIRYAQKTASASLNSLVEFIPKIGISNNKPALTLYFAMARLDFLGNVASTKILSKYKLLDYTVDFSDAHATVRVLAEAENMPPMYPSKYLCTQEYKGPFYPADRNYFTTYSNVGKFYYFNGYVPPIKTENLISQKTVKLSKKELHIFDPENYTKLSPTWTCVKSSDWRGDTDLDTLDTYLRYNPLYVFGETGSFKAGVYRGHRTIYLVGGGSVVGYDYVGQIPTTTNTGTFYYGRRFFVPYKVTSEGSNKRYYFYGVAPASSMWIVTNDFSALSLSVTQYSSDFSVLVPAYVTNTVIFAFAQEGNCNVNFGKFSQLTKENISGLKFYYGLFSTFNGVLVNDWNEAVGITYNGYNEYCTLTTEVHSDVQLQSFLHMQYHNDSKGRPVWIDYPTPILFELKNKEQWLMNLFTQPLERLRIATTEFIPCGQLVTVGNLGTFRIVRAKYDIMKGKIVKAEYELHRRGSYYPSQLDVDIQGVFWDEQSGEVLKLAQRKLIQ